MKMYQSVRTGEVVNLVSEAEFEVTLKLESTGEIKTVSPSTFKRWWKAMPAPEAREMPMPPVEVPIMAEPVEVIVEPVEAIVVDVIVPELKIAKAKTKKVPAEKPVKVAKVAKSKVKTIPEIKFFLDELAIKKGCTLFSGKVKVFVAVKFNGKTLFAYTFNNEGITIWIRSKVAEAYTTNYVVKNHLFDARITLDGAATKESKELITNLLAASKARETAKPSKEKK